MPWSKSNPPRPSKNWPAAAQGLCIRVANGALRGGSSDQDAIYACIAAVKKKYPGVVGKKHDDTNVTTAALEFSEQFYSVPEIELQEDGGRYTSSFQVLPEGSFVHPWYGDLDFSAPILRAFKRNFDKNVLGTEIMVDEGHNRGKALGWFKQLHHGKRTVGEAEYQGLFADVEWTELGREYLERKIYKYFSAEVGNYTGPDGTKIENVLLGGGLTNRPFFKQMPAVKFQEGNARDRFVIGLFGDDHWRFDDSPDTADKKTTNFSTNYHGDVEEGDDEEVAMEELLDSINEALGTHFSDGGDVIPVITEMRANADLASKFRTTFAALGFEFKDGDDPVGVVAREFKALKDNNSSLDDRLKSVEVKLTDAEFETAFSDNLRIGKVVPAQKPAMLKLFRTDKSLFNDLMKDQKAIVELGELGTTGSHEEPGSEGEQKYTGDDAVKEARRYVSLAGGKGAS